MRLMMEKGCRVKVEMKSEVKARSVAMMPNHR